jgi:hypothetical protein
MNQENSISPEPKRKPIKKKTCNCAEYKKEIIELNEIIAELRVKETELNKLKSNFTDISYGTENNYENISYTDCSEDSIKFPTLKEIEDQFNIENNLVGTTEQLIYNDHFINEKGEFDNKAFNKQFEQTVREKNMYINGKNKFDNEIINKPFIKNINESFMDEKAEYNPNFLPIKELSGFEKFDNDAFNRVFEEQKNAGIQINSVLSSFF